MQLGMIGRGRMGANMVRSLISNGHTCVVYEHCPAAIQALVLEGAQGAKSLESVIGQPAPPRAVWLMVPAAVVDATPPAAVDSPAAPTSTAELGYLQCGQTGAGHFVKTVHNAIEYGLMEAYAEGLNIQKHADAGKSQRSIDAETTPLRYPEHYEHDFDVAAVAEVWRHGSAMRFQFGGHVERFVGE